MADIIIYTKDYCPYCSRAKSLLERKGVTFKEKDITTDEALQQEMLGKANGRKTVPQIFIGSTHVGGFDDLSALDREGKLDTLLAG